MFAKIENVYTKGVAKGSLVIEGTTGRTTEITTNI